MSKLSDTVERKFIDTIDVDEYEIWTDEGWKDLTQIHKTIEYEEWEISTESNKSLVCADTHILFDEHMNEIFTKDCIPNETYIITEDGKELVTSVKNINQSSNMFDVTVSDIHRFYANGILSHNSATIVAYVLWETIFHPDIAVGFASYRGDASKDLIVRFKYAYENLPDFLKPIVTSYNVHDIAFDNKSSVISQTTTENTFRGKSLSIIFLDELAFVKPKVAREFWKSLLPSLTAGAGLKKGRDLKLIITSTPNGSENKFAELWFKADQNESDFHAMRVYNEEVKGRDEAFKQNMLQTMSQDEYDQEYGCMFISTSGTLIHSRFLEALRPKEPIKTHDSIDLFNHIKGKRLAIAVDVGTGVGSDYSVVQIFDMDTLEQLGEYRNNQLTTSEFTKKLIKILEYLDKEGATEIYYSVEANSIGQGVINLLNIASSPVLKKAELIIERKLRKHGGMLTTTKSKMKGCMKFKDLVEKDQMTIHSKNLLSELKFFVKSGASFKAEIGMTDDLVMGCVILTNMLAEIALYDEVVYDTINSIKEFDLEGSEDDDPMPFIM